MEQDYFLVSENSCILSLENQVSWHHLIEEINLNDLIDLIFKALLPYDPLVCAVQPYQDQDYQDVYFVADSLEDALQKFRLDSYRICMFLLLATDIYFLLWTLAVG